MYKRKTTDRCFYCDTLVQSWWGSAPCGYVCSKGQRLILYLLNCITQPKSKPMGSRALGLWPMADKKKKKSRQNACTAHARGHLLKFLLCLSFGAGLTVCLISVCRLVAPPPSQPDWQCSGERLSAQIDFFAPWGVDMLHLTGRWLCVACLPC